MKEQTNTITVRLPFGLSLGISSLSIETGLSKSYLIRLAITDLMLLAQHDLVYDGIDLKKYAEETRRRMRRRLITLSTTEMLSEILFPLTIHKNAFKIVKSYRKREEQEKHLRRYLENCRIVAETYKNKVELLNVIDDYEKVIGDNITKIKGYIETHLEDEQKTNK